MLASRCKQCESAVRGGSATGYVGELGHMCSTLVAWMRKLALSSSVSTDSGIRGHVVRKGIHASNILVLYPVS